MMKRLAFVILAAALAWSGYWLWGKQSLMAGYQRWFAERRDDGWEAGYAEMKVRGFPNRHDTTWTDLRILDPESGLGWEAPFFQLFLLSYNRHHAIAAWPRHQVIVTPDGPLHVTSEQMQASLVTEGEDHALTRGTLVADVLNITGTDGATTALAQLRLAGTRVDAASYDVALTAEGLALPRGLNQATGGALPQTFSEARIAAQLGFDAPWTLTSAEARPQPTRIAVREAALEWGPMALRLTGDLEIDGEGHATGDVHVQAQNWQEMLAVARASGQVADVLADGVEATLTLMAGLSGGRRSLDLTLRLEEGAIWLGPVPVGEAPRFLLR